MTRICRIQRCKKLDELQSIFKTVRLRVRCLDELKSDLFNVAFSQNWSSQVRLTLTNVPMCTGLPQKWDFSRRAAEKASQDF